MTLVEIEIESVAPAVAGVLCGTVLLWYAKYLEAGFVLAFTVVLAGIQATE
ncbi:hypothetical protein GWK26_08550 [haloarchaeon 3A1-DGR]|nr:hypothetical protein GWK26_08550 [haloarchaeon 3A1-DGR]